MKTINFNFLTKSIPLLLILIGSNSVLGQDLTTPKSKSIFWEHVQFGGGLGLAIGSGYTDITVAPSAIYNFNQYLALGLGLQGSYIKVKNDYSNIIYGGSVVGLFNPIEEIQLSLEVEQVRVNTTFQAMPDDVKRNFWNTGLFVGAGYRTENVTIGARYNLLFDKDKSVYSDALMPFIRVYF
jgi:long-subunit fatty acid transport protein